MPSRRDSRTGRWFFRTTVAHTDGTKERVSGTPGIPGPYQDLANTRVGANEAERRAVAAALAGKALAGSAEAKKEADEKKLPTFKEWFHGRFWLEHVPL